MSEPGNFIRGPRKQDQSYIASTWVKQLTMSDKAGAIGARYGNHGRNVDALLERSDTRAIVRHAPEDPDGIRGWLVYAEGPGVPLIHFCYVRKQHRGHGYASQLLAHIGVKPDTAFVYTSCGPMSAKLLSRFKAGAFLSLSEFLS